MATCRDCGAPIRFVRVFPDFRAMPIDPLPDNRGNVYAWPHTPHRWAGTVVAVNATRAIADAALERFGRSTIDTDRFMPHAATCSGRARTPRPRPDPTPEPEPGLF